MPKYRRELLDAQETWEWKIGRAKKVRKNWKELFRIEMIKNMLDGKQNPGYPANEWITINKMYSHMKAQLPALYAVDPYFYVKLSRSFSPNPMDIVLWEKRGKIRQNALNYYKTELKLKEKARLAIYDGHYSYGVIKTHYYADLKEHPNAGEQINGDDDIPLVDDSGGPLTYPDYIPTNERYVIDRIHPDDFLWDEDAGPLEDSWSWVAQRIKETYGEIKKNTKFDRR